jgi:hypothetical protein
MRAALTLAVGLGIVVVLSPVRVAAQESATWGGLALVAASSGLGVQLDLSRLSGTRLYRLRYGGHSAAVMNMGGPADAGSLTELSLMIGRGRSTQPRWHSPSNWVAIAGGLSLVDGTSEGRDYTTFGIAGEAHMISRRAPHLVFSAIGNLNPHKPFVGFTLGIALGRMPW